MVLFSLGAHRWHLQPPFLSDALHRNFNLPKAEEFDAFVKAFDHYEDLPYEESLSFAVRLHVTGRVCTTNEGKKGGQVLQG